MEVACPHCRYRTEKDVSIDEVTSCPWCGQTYEIMGDVPAISEALVEFYSVPSTPQPRRPSAIVPAAFVLSFLAVILFLPAWSRHQDAVHQANSPPGQILSCRGAVLKVVFSPDGKRLASAGGVYRGRNKWETGEITIWDPTTGQPLLTFPGHPEGVTDVDFSPDGKRLASASSDGVKIWDTNSGKELLSLRMQPKEKPYRVAFDPRGTRLTTLSETAFLGKGRARLAIKVWHVPDMLEGEKKAPLFYYRLEAGPTQRTGGGHPWPVFSPDGKLLACACDNNVLIWDLASDGRGPDAPPALILEKHTQPIRHQAFSPDGKRLAVAADDETLSIWDVASGKELFSFESPREGIPGYRSIACLAFSPDGKLLAGGKAQNLAIWDATTGTQLHFLRWHTWNVESVAFSPDGQTLASGSSDCQIKLWDLQALRAGAKKEESDGIIPVGLR